MKIYIMTDMEGVAGILDSENWCKPEGKYYELGKELLTEEVNAAIDGFFQEGAQEIVVADGHGSGGINPLLLDSRVKLLRGWPEGWPLMLNETYSYVAWIGQHAKAGTKNAHLPHTQHFGYLDLSINGVSIGEFGQLALCAGELGVKSIFASGDLALTHEAKKLVPGIEVVAVKEGHTPGTGDDLKTEEYRRKNKAAVHFHPVKARKLIKKGARRALNRANKKDFGIATLQKPYKRVAVFRPAEDGQPVMISREKHPSSIAELMNMPFDKYPIKKEWRRNKSI